MENSRANLYNRPLRTALLLSVLSIALILVTAAFYIFKPFTLSQNSMYRGMALYSDIMNIFLGYVIILGMFVLGLVNGYLSYGARRSDKPETAKVTAVISWITVGAAFVFAVWFTLTVLSLYNALGIFA